MIEKAPHLHLGPDEPALRASSKVSVDLGALPDRRQSRGKCTEVERLTRPNLASTTEFTEDNATGAASRAQVVGNAHLDALAKEVRSTWLTIGYMVGI
jgi:hypothetical protein